VLLSLRQADILKALAANEELSANGGGVPDLQDVKAQISNPLPVFHPEFGRFMLEATPGKPWGIDLKELLSVESDMKTR
jgi:glutamate--cysteine ligase catalytic subunit